MLRKCGLALNLPLFLVVWMASGEFRLNRVDQLMIVDKNDSLVHLLKRFGDGELSRAWKAVDPYERCRHFWVSRRENTNQANTRSKCLTEVQSYRGPE